VVGAATARIGDFRIDLFIGWIGMSPKQSRDAYYHARLAVTALRYVEVDPCALHGMRPVGRQTFDGGHGFAGGSRDWDAARANRLAVNVKRTGPALGYATTEFGSCQPKLIADNPEKGRIRRNIDRMPNAIHGKVHGHSVLP
jgi:hypothetical protein